MTEPSEGKKIEVGDWVRLTGEMWASEYPNAPEYVRITDLSSGPYRFITTNEVGDVGDKEGLYTEEGNEGFGVEHVPGGRLPYHVKFVSQRSTGIPYADAVEALRTDNPVSPDHYSYPGGVQVIDLTRHMDFLLGNVVKYVARAGRKGTRLEDLQKAAQYLAWAIEDEETK